jgi:tetratricopeptide (TPR) repeat protein
MPGGLFLSCEREFTLIHTVFLSMLLWQQPSFIEQSISIAREEIAKEPNRPEGYNDLALALARKVRETGDSSFAAQAEAAIARSLKLVPANFEARRARVAVRLAQQRYDDVLEEAEALRKERPDDNPIYSYISEAQIALGKYGESEKAVQRMIDLRSVNGPGFEAGAHLRELIGFPDAALDWWRSGLNLVSDRDTEERAYISSQMARIYRETGRYDAAVESAKQALSLEPNYPAALFELARVRIEQKQTAEAISLLQTRLRQGKDLASLYWLSVAQEQSGSSPAAAFEKEARAASGSPGNADALLVRFLADHGNTSEAIAIAKGALERHHDVYTRQSYAVALAKAGQSSEALIEIRKALEPGILDVSLYFDAGVIARQDKNSEAASAYFKKAFELGSSGSYSGEIMKQLGSLAYSAPN